MNKRIWIEQRHRAGDKWFCACEKVVSVDSRIVFLYLYELKLQITKMQQKYNGNNPLMKVLRWYIESDTNLLEHAYKLRQQGVASSFTVSKKVKDIYLIYRRAAY